MKRHEDVYRELNSIRRKHNNVLRPRDVVEFARNPKTALHHEFEWNDTAAAMYYRRERRSK